MLRLVCYCLRSPRGGMNARSFLFWLDVPASTFTKTVFDLICKNLTLSGEMRSFEDFLVATITFCMFSQNDLLRLVFNAIDADSSGMVNEEEYVALLVRRP